jgi:hypothetical protein
MTDTTPCPDCQHRLSGHKLSSSEDPETVEGCLWCSCRHRALCPCAGCDKKREPYTRHWFMLIKVESGVVVKKSTIYGPFSRHLQMTCSSKETPMLRVGPGMHGNYIVADGADLVFWSGSDDRDDSYGWRLNYDNDNTYYSDIVMWSTPTDEPAKPPEPWTEEFKWHGE